MLIATNVVQDYSSFMLRILTDSTDTDQVVTIMTPLGRSNINANMLRVE